MRIIIVGGGKVGFSLAKQLENEDHEITVIDTNEHVINQISSSLDVYACVGNGAVYSVLKSAGVENCDLLIAVTATDEINLLCCLGAHKLGAKRTIARVRNPEYSEQLVALKDDIGLSMSINPERAAAAEIARLLRFPAASQVELFAHGRVELVSCKVTAGNILCDLKLCDLQKTIGAKVLICAVTRGDETTIPSGGFVLKEGDELYLTGAPGEIRRVFKKADLFTDRVRTVMIGGGGKITYYLAQILSRENISVKIIEKDEARASALAAALPKAVILNGDIADYELLNEESVDRQDAFVALTGLDEGNILSALYADRRSVNTVIAKVNNENLYSLIKNSNIDAVVSPKNVTANLICGYVRALDARNPESSVLSLCKLVDGRVEALEFRAREKDKGVIGVPLMELRMKKNMLVACLVRKGRVIIPGGADYIQAGDSVLVVTAGRRLGALTDILEA